jgi:hypothetical protein
MNGYDERPGLAPASRRREAVASPSAPCADSWSAAGSTFCRLPSSASSSRCTSFAAAHDGIGGLFTVIAAAGHACAVGLVLGKIVRRVGAPRARPGPIACGLVDGEAVSGRPAARGEPTKTASCGLARLRRTSQAEAAPYSMTVVLPPAKTGGDPIAALTRAC